MFLAVVASNRQDSRAGQRKEKARRPAEEAASEAPLNHRVATRSDAETATAGAAGVALLLLGALAVAAAAGLMLRAGRRWTTMETTTWMVVTVTMAVMISATTTTKTENWEMRQINSCENQSE